jgi:iron(III) transport system ATP-binding protein
MTSLEIKNLDVSFGARKVLDNLSFSLNSGEIAALLGPSGCGKTTLLRSIAGLIQPDTGTIRFGKQLVSLSSLSLPAHKRKIGYVPQEGALFPHLNIAENIAFGIDRSAFTKEQIKQTVKEMLALIDLVGLDNRMPNELSGGQQTRVALARALAVKPAMILLDEPFSALDAHLRAELRTDVINLLRSQKTTAILVTHDREEALVSSDVIALMRDGKIMQQGSPEQVYSFPSSATTAMSTGDTLVLHAKRLSNGDTSYLFNSNQSDSKVLESGEIIIRPEEIKISRDLSSDKVKGEITKIDFYGHDAMVEISVANELVQVRIPGPLSFVAGEKVSLEHVGPIRFFAQADSGSAK